MRVLQTARHDRQSGPAQTGRGKAVSPPSPHLAELQAQADAPIQRIISEETFQEQTPGRLLAPRKAVARIDPLIAAYHNAPSGGKAAAHAALLTEINAYIAGKAGDPTNKRLTPVTNLRTALVAETAAATMMDTLAGHGVQSDMTSVGMVAAIPAADIAILGPLAQVTAPSDLLALHRLSRTNADIATLAALPQFTSFNWLRTLAALPRITAEISQIANLHTVGLGGVMLPSQPTYYDLLEIAKSAHTIADITNAMTTWTITQTSHLTDICTKGYPTGLLSRRGMIAAAERMYYIPMNLIYGQPASQATRLKWGAHYGSVFAIGHAADKLATAAADPVILAELQTGGVLSATATAVPQVIIDTLSAGWLATHTGAAGVGYAGGDTGGDTRLNGGDRND
ncbi:MAG: hypothetical protein AAFV09_11495 [Pseudomonadota bacterium]